MDIKEKVKYMLWDIRIQGLVAWVILEKRIIKLKGR